MQAQCGDPAGKVTREMHPWEVQVVDLLRKSHYEVLHNISKDEKNEWATNGGVMIVCGDGDIDVFRHYTERVTDRPHAIKLFGGPLLMSPSFPGYGNGDDDRVICRHLALGRNVKRTLTVFPTFHFPCALGLSFGVDLIDTLGHIAAVVERLKHDGYKPCKIHPMLHIKYRHGEKFVQKTFVIAKTDGLQKIAEDMSELFIEHRTNK